MLNATSLSIALVLMATTGAAQPVSCSVPASGGADVPVTLDLGGAPGDWMRATLEFSVDGGLSWLRATPAGGSPLSNPSASLVAPTMDQVLWDTLADGVGFQGPQAVDLRFRLHGRSRYSLGPAANTPVFRSTYHVAAGDLDQDGDTDWVAANRNSVVFYWNDWPGYVLQEFPVSGISSVALGDLDGDFDLDCVIGIRDPAGANLVLRSQGGMMIDSGQALGNRSTYDVELFDADGDGDLDLVCGNGFAAPRENTVWWNDGGGNFSDSGQRLGNEADAYLAAGDFDGDGDVDFVAGQNGGLVPVHLWRNDGAGTFTASPVPGAAATVSDIASGDLNGDGHIDFVNRTLDAVEIHRGDGMGGFTLSSTLAVMGEGDVQVVDVDGDGDLDVHAASTSGPNRVWLGDGAGSFVDSGHSFGSAPSLAMVAIDLNSDSHLDMIEARGSGAPHTTLQHLNQSTFLTTTCEMVGMLVVDNRVDCALAAPSPGTALRGDAPVQLDSAAGGAGVPLTTTFEHSTDGGATWTASTPAAGSVLGNPDPLRPAPFTEDFEWDTISDGLGLTGQQLVTLRATTHTGSVPPAPGITLVGTGVSHPDASMSKMSTGDLDGDGNLDLVTVDSHTGIKLWRGDGAGGLVNTGQVFPGGSTTCAAVADLDGDADMDIVVGSFGGGDLVLLNQGSGGFTGIPLPWVTETVTLTVGDLDGDGHLDLVTGGLEVVHPSFEEPNQVYLGDGAGGFTNTGQVLGTYTTRGVELGDLDGDGDLDLVQASQSQSNHVWWNDGTGMFTDSGQSIGRGRSATLGDFDGDGDLDLASDELGSGGVVWWNDGAGNFTNSGQVLGSKSWFAVDAVDLDGDFDLDLVVGDRGRDGEVWLNDGAGNFSDAGITLPDSILIATADLDADGKPDVLGASTHFSVFMNETPRSVETSCEQTCTVDNRPAPTCTLSAPARAAGDIAITVDTFSATTATVDVLLECSTDGGASFLPITLAASSPASSNPAIGVPTGPLDFHWDSVADGVGTIVPAPAVIVCATIEGGMPETGACTTMLEVENRLSCAISSPPAAAVVSGDVNIAFDGITFLPGALTSTFDYSTDAGATWFAATPAAGSALANPDPARPAPFSGATFTWDSLTDGVGTMMPTSTMFRVATGFGGATSECLRSFVVNNVPAPTCTLTAPAGLAAGDVALTLDLAATGSTTVDVRVEFSLDGGATFQLATPAMGSPLAVNPASSHPVGLTAFHWDTAADGVGITALAPGVIVRVTVDSIVSLSTGSCTETFDVDNRPTCGITSPPAGSLVSGEVDITLDGDAPGTGMVSSQFEVSTDGGASWLVATAAPSSPTPNPDPLRATPFTGAVFRWDSVADTGTTTPVMATFRAVTDSGVATRTCEVALEVNNVAPPSCALTAPAGAQSRDVLVNLSIASSTAATLDLSLDFSLDGGATYQAATLAVGSTVPSNPAAGIPVGPTDLLWDTVADGVGITTPASGVVLRLTVSDGVALTDGECTATLDVDNTGVCTTQCGDCDGNGAPSEILDALAAAQASLGLLSPSPQQAACCDVDANGRVDILDALGMAQAATGLPVSLTCP